MANTIFIPAQKIEWSSFEVELGSDGVYFIVTRQNKQDFGSKISKDDAIRLANGILDFFSDRALDSAIRATDDEEVEPVIINKSFFADWTFFRVFLNVFNKLFSLFGFVNRADHPTDESSKNNGKNIKNKKHPTKISKNKKDVK